MAHRPIRLDDSLEELAPFMRVTVIPGVTVGDLGFSSAQSVFSTGYVKPSAADNFAAAIDLDLFQAAIGDNGQGLGAGALMTRSQTNWLDSNGRLSDNEVFVGIRAMFSVYKHWTAGATTGPTLIASDSLVLIQNPIAVWQICKQLSWQYQIGDGIIRNCGALAGYPQAGGVFEPPAQISASAAVVLPPTPPVVVTTIETAVASAVGGTGLGRGAQNGTPKTCLARDLPIPFLFYPSISTKIKVISGSPMDLSGLGTTVAGSVFAGAAEFLAIKMTIQGYKLTMPV